MFDRIVIQKALKRIWALDNNPGVIHSNPSGFYDSRETSLLIYDIFGGEILKTHKKKGWHFYNRIDGERIDFTRTVKGKSSKNKYFEDIPSTPDEICNYFEQEDYSTLSVRFISAYEEAAGQGNYRSATA